MPTDRADEIISDANGNMRKAILVFEAMKMQSYVDTWLCLIRVAKKIWT